MPLLMLIQPFLSIIQRLALYVAVIAAIFMSGFFYRMSYEKTQILKTEIKQMAEIKKVENKLQVKADEVGQKIADKQVETKIVYKTITKEVIKYVEKNPSATIVVDPTFGMLFNSSSKGCDPTESACISESGISEGVTNAELIQTITEQHQIYQDCRLTVSGWQEFYSNLKKETDNVNSR